MRRRPVLTIVGAVLLTLSACGDDADEDADEPVVSDEDAVTTATADDTDGGDDDTDGGDDAGGEYVEAFAASIRAGDDSQFEGDQVDCIAENVVDVIGVERLEEAGTPEEVTALDRAAMAVALDLDDDEARAVGAAVVDCDISFAAVATGDELPGDVVACIDDNLSDDDLAEILGQVLFASDGFNERFNSIVGGLLQDCPGFADVVG